MFFDDPVPVLGHFLSIFPSHKTVAKLRQNLVVVLPCFKIDGDPRPLLARPVKPSLLKDATPRLENRAGALETLVLLVDGLRTSLSCTDAPLDHRTYLDGLLEHGGILVDRGTARGQIIELNEIVPTRDRNRLLGEFHSMQPILYVLDLVQGKQQPQLAVREGPWRS